MCTCVYGTREAEQVPSVARRYHPRPFTYTPMSYTVHWVRRPQLADSMCSLLVRYTAVSRTEDACVRDYGAAVCVHQVRRGDF